MAQKKKSPGTDPEKEYPDIKPYAPKDDIYSRDSEEEDIDPEDITRTKAPNTKPGKRNEEDFEDDMTGEDLDVPGNEQDEDSEDNGDEDEENNYYSEADN